MRHKSEITTSPLLYALMPDLRVNEIVEIQQQQKKSRSNQFGCEYKLLFEKELFSQLKVKTMWKLSSWLLHFCASEKFKNQRCLPKKQTVKLPEVQKCKSSLENFHMVSKLSQ